MRAQGALRERGGCNGGRADGGGGPAPLSLRPLLPVPPDQPDEGDADGAFGVEGLIVPSTNPVSHAGEGRVWNCRCSQITISTDVGEAAVNGVFSVRRMCALFLAACAFIAAPSIACGPPSFNFERRSARLSPTVDDRLTETVGNFRRARQGSRLHLTAWGDSTGTTVANRRLAQRRANAVSAALIRRGIPRRAIDISIRSVPKGGPDGWVWAEVIGAQAGCG